MRDAVEFIQKMNFKLPPLPFGARRIGRKKEAITMRFGTICWDGTSRTLAPAITGRSGS
ncbi:MAG: hypothetical protein ACLR23_10185 [Clostridia bacterium]